MQCQRPASNSSSKSLPAASTTTGLNSVDENANTGRLKPAANAPSSHLTCMTGNVSGTLAVLNLDSTSVLVARIHQPPQWYTCDDKMVPFIVRAPTGMCLS